MYLLRFLVFWVVVVGFASCGAEHSSRSAAKLEILKEPPERKKQLEEEDKTSFRLKVAPPPIPRSSTVMPESRPGFAYQPGHYRYDTKKETFVWVAGRFLEKREGKDFHLGHWSKDERGWFWVEGRWD